MKEPELLVGCSLTSSIGHRNRAAVWDQEVTVRIQHPPATTGTVVAVSSYMHDKIPAPFLMLS